MVVATVEVIVVQTIEVILLVFPQLLVSLLVLDGNTRMPSVVALVVHKEQLVVAMDAIALYLLATQSQGWCKLPHQSRLLGHGNLPDAEESQDMVNAVGVEVLCHLAEAVHPPAAVVLHHLIPVVGGESPVLAVGRERIGWGTGLLTHVEVAGFYPSLYAVA